MKKSKILLGVLLAVLMISLLSVTAMAATVTPGGSTSISLSVPDVCGVQVTDVSSSGSSSLSAGSASVSGSGFIEGGVGFGSSQATYYVSVDVSASSSAKVGDSLTVTIYYDYTTDSIDLHSSSYTETVTVVGGGSSGGGDTPITPDQPTQPDKPSEPAVKIDYSELNKWIKEKQGLDSSKYTKDTWDPVEEAYNKALNLRNSKKQDAVDAGAKALKEAIEGLKEMDYTLLEEAIAAAKKLGDSEELGSLWMKLADALKDSVGLLTSNDQQAVNDGAALINSIISQLNEELEKLREANAVYEGDYCNISIHHVWPILFFVSLGVNVILAIVAIMLGKRRMGNKKDNTPLVDYQISDDE